MCEEIVGISIADTSDQHGATTFESDAGICAEVPGGLPVTSFIKSVGSYQDLKEYFRRPRMVFSGSCATTRTNLIQQDVNDSWLFAGAFPSGYTRLAGVTGVRFTMRFIVTMAATPFQQGMLALAFQYGAATLYEDVYPRCNSSALVTQLPHVRLDLAESTRVELEVPFLYHYDYMPLDRSSYYTLGIVSLNQVIPYQTLTTAAAPTYKVYVALEDLELIGSAPMSYTYVTPQSGIRTKQASSAGPDRVKAEQKHTGVVSGVLSTVADAVGVLTSGIPSLSAIGGPTQWFLNASAGAAAAFGYSKPVVETEPVRHWRTDYIADANVDVPNTSFVVAPFQSNKLRVDATLGGTDTDEMSFKYILGKYGQIFMGDMSTTDSAGTALYATQICPNSFWFRSNSSRPGGNLVLPNASTASTNAIQPTPLLYFADMFRYWRGSVKFRFTFAKTKFHGGRVLISFVPVPQTASHVVYTTPTVPASESSGALTQPFNYSKVFDLRDSNVVEFEVPYVAPWLYMDTTGSTGGLTMRVVDPLLISGEVASTINYLVEVCAGDDFELAGTVQPSLTQASLTGTVFLQSGLAGVGPSVANTSEYTMGEKVNSAKQLMMIPSSYSTDITNLTVNTTNLPPWFYRPRWTMATPMSPTASNFGGFTRSGNVAACYAFVNGSTVYHVYNSGGNGTSTSIFASGNVGGDTTIDTIVNPRNKDAITSGPLRYYSTERSQHAVLPLYSKLARVSLWQWFASISARNWGAWGTRQYYADDQASTLYLASVRNTSGGTVRYVLSRAAGEDARCSAFIGAPPVILFNSAATVSPDSNGSY